MSRAALPAALPALACWGQAEGGDQDATVWVGANLQAGTRVSHALPWGAALRSWACARCFIWCRAVQAPNPLDRLLSPLRLGAEEVLPALTKLAGAVAVRNLQGAALRRLATDVVRRAAQYESAVGALLAAGGKKALRSKAAVQVRAPWSPASRCVRCVTASPQSKEPSCRDAAGVPLNNPQVCSLLAGRAAGPHCSGIPLRGSPQRAGAGDACDVGAGMLGLAANQPGHGLCPGVPRHLLPGTGAPAAHARLQLRPCQLSSGTVGLAVALYISVTKPFQVGGNCLPPLVVAFPLDDSLTAAIECLPLSLIVGVAFVLRLWMESLCCA